jgi:hypothetical protein
MVIYFLMTVGVNSFWCGSRRRFFQVGEYGFYKKWAVEKHSETLTLPGVPNLIRDEAGEEPSGSSTHQYAIEES